MWYLSGLLVQALGVLVLIICALRLLRQFWRLCGLGIDVLARALRQRLLARAPMATVEVRATRPTVNPLLQTRDWDLDTLETPTYLRRQQAGSSSLAQAALTTQGVQP